MKNKGDTSGEETLTIHCQDETIMAATPTLRLIDYPPHRPHSLGHLTRSLLKGIGDRFEQWLAPTFEPTVVQRNNQHDIPYWEIYNPETKRTIYCASEAEVALWLNYSHRR